jgi:hypothetical protein
MHLSYDITKSVVAADMRTADTLMDSVASGHKRMQLICSASGFGKTSIAKKRFRQYGIVSEKEFYRSLSPLPDTSRPQTRQTGMRRAVLAMRPFESAKKRLLIEARPTKPISLVRICTNARCFRHLHCCSMIRAASPAMRRHVTS